LNNAPIRPRTNWRPTEPPAERMALLATVMPMLSGVRPRRGLLLIERIAELTMARPAELAAAAATGPDPVSGNPSSLPLGFFRPTAAPAPGAAGRGGITITGGGRGGAFGAMGFRTQLNKFLKEEGVLVVLTPGNGPDGGTIMGQAAGSQNPTAELPPPSVVITNEHYNRIARLLAKDIPVTLEFDLGAKFTDAGDSFNLVGEIPGTDPNAGFVMLGGHFDSWTGGTGATDNAAGAAVALEAIRILKTLDVKNCKGVTEAGVTKLKQAIPGVEVLQ